MPLQKIVFRPGVNRENTRYTTEGGWYECDKIRFRQGNPETIGGWVRFSANTFLGICRSLWNWATLSGLNLIGVGTNLKFYIEEGGAYNDITPIRTTATLTNPFTATNGSRTITVNATTHGCNTGDFVTFSGATGLGGNITAAVLNQEYQVTVVSNNSYTFEAKDTAGAAVFANATDVAGSPGGGTVTAAYQVNTGPAIEVPLTGWGAGPWGEGAWGEGVPGTGVISLRLWSQDNYGEDLIFGPRGGGMYYWTAAAGVGTRGVNMASLLGSSDVPVVQNTLAVSDASRFVIAFGCNELGFTTLDPMLIRWSDQEDAFNWTPSVTNQAGGVRLSHGSEIITAIQARQEIVVFTDASVYSMQYLGPPVVWGTQLLGDNISIMGQNAAVLASGVVYWMGTDKFYAYDGRVQTLNCDLRRYVFENINYQQTQQIFAGTNEGFNEVWWFYCSANSTVIDRYVVYNYMEKIWYYGVMSRTAWLDSGIRSYPVAATYNLNLVNHEQGINNNETGTPTPINAYIASSEFDIGDGHNFGFVWRILPDLTFANSTNSPEGLTPRVTMSLQGLQNSGSGVTSQAGSTVAKTSQYVVSEEFTGQIYTRIRARQMNFRIESNQLNTAWQLGAPRIDIRPDGRR